MTPESQFLGLTFKPKRRSRKFHKNYEVTVLPTVKARGRYRKGEGFNKGLHVTRSPVYVPPPARM